MSSEGPFHLRDSLQPISMSCTTALLCNTHLLLLMKDLIRSQDFQREMGASENLSVPATLPLLLQIHSRLLQVPGGCRTN